MAEHRENDRQNPPEAIPIRDHFRPVINNHYSGIARGTINANNFELKPALINMVQQNQFAGTATADPHIYLMTFLEITDMRMAPIASLGKYHDMAGAGDEISGKILSPAKSAQLKIEIITFRQTDFEQLYEAWERYKDLLRKCPNHGFEDWVQIELFYNGLNGQTRGTVSALTTQLAAMNKVSTLETEDSSTVVEELSLPKEAQYINNRNFGGFGGYRGFNTSNGEAKPSFKDLVGTFVSESGTVSKAADPNLMEVNDVFIQHEEIGRINIEEKKADHTPIRDEKPTPTKGVRAEFQEKKDLEDLKNLHSNIQSAELEDVAFTGGDDKGRQGTISQKLQDPGEFVVPCEIGGQLVEKAEQTMRPTGLSLQMADKSVRTPLGIVEDVELRIDKLRLPEDVVVLYMGDSQNVRTILERPFLDTAGAVIDLRQKNLTMEVDGQKVELKASKISHDPS
ncbi:uncharacterized protein [Primulina eburnea]|uniref:uncharacterized protein n=1 Tax=Primulina eburnea TaxID=1245227 RepID=UPI003C6BFA6E